MKRNLTVIGVIALIAALALGVVFAISPTGASPPGPGASSPAAGPTPPPAPIPAEITQPRQPPKLTDEQIARAKRIFESDARSQALFEGHPYTITSVYPSSEGDTGTLIGAAIDVRLDQVAATIEGEFPTSDYLGEGRHNRYTRRLIVEGAETFGVRVDLRDDAVVSIRPVIHRDIQRIEGP